MRDENEIEREDAEMKAILSMNERLLRVSNQLEVIRQSMLRGGRTPDQAIRDSLEYVTQALTPYGHAVELD